MLMSHMRSVLINRDVLPRRCLHVSTALNKTQAGRYRPIAKHPQPLTYEMANPPHYIAARKSWNSWNTSNLKDGNRSSETLVEDLFIRNFIQGTWSGLLVSEVIIKRQHNIVRIASIIVRKTSAQKVYFLLGYTETLLSFWLHCPVKLELQTTDNKEDVIYKVI